MTTMSDANSIETAMSEGVVISTTSTPAESILEGTTEGAETPATEITVTADMTSTEPRAASESDTTVIETTPTSKEKDSEKEPEVKLNEDGSLKIKKQKPKILKVEQYGIYTVKHLEASNFLAEWYKGLRASIPYMLRLIKIYWSMSPVRASILVTTNLIKALLPTLTLWVSKEFLDQVQFAADGKVVSLKRLIVLALLGVGTKGLEQGLNIITDKVDGVLERRLSLTLDTQLIDAYLRLDTDQLASRKVRGLFSKAKSFSGRDPSTLILTWLDSMRYMLTIASSSYALSRLMSKNATNLILLNGLKTLANLWRLGEYHAGGKRYEVLNQPWHRLNLMKTFSLSDTLRRDITVTGLEPWLLSEFKSASAELGDTPTKAPYYSRARDNSSFRRALIVNIVNSLEYMWLIYEGYQKGVSLGTLHLIRSSTETIMDKIYSLTYTADRASDEWKSLVSFFRCLELKAEMAVPADPVEYVSQEGGMKLEARSIRYKYDAKKDVEVLKGASFVINPGEMIAVVGFNGAGKSTLARLLTRLANVSDGEFLINDVNVKNYDPVTLRRHIAVLFQDIGQYAGLTILENIGVGKVENLKDKEAIHQSAKDAGADDFIKDLPYAYDCYLGHAPGGTTMSWGAHRWDDSDSDSDDEDEEKKEQEKKVQKNLSGGQWQKVALARAFMRGNEADLLVLDEPTANLDPEAEYNLFETIKKLRKGRTTVYISHRFNTVRAADRIMVMEDGDVKEFGTHEELMDLKDGRYHRLYTLQAKGFLLDDKGGVSKDVDGMIVNVKEEVVKVIVEETS